MREFILKGKVLNLGAAVGTVKIVNNHSDFKSQEILVAKNYTTDLRPLVKKAKAVIIESAGNNDLKMICRELNIPCAVEVKNATKVLKNKEPIELDCDNLRFAKIYQIEKPNFSPNRI
jgi:phosphohistidine swiveling domain-containing protein